MEGFLLFAFNTFRVGVCRLRRFANIYHSCCHYDLYLALINMVDSQQQPITTSSCCHNIDAVSTPFLSVRHERPALVCCCSRNNNRHVLLSQMVILFTPQEHTDNPEAIQAGKCRKAARRFTLRATSHYAFYHLLLPRHLTLLSPIQPLLHTLDIHPRHGYSPTASPHSYWWFVCHHYRYMSIFFHQHPTRRHELPDIITRLHYNN